MRMLRLIATVIIALSSGGGMGWADTTSAGPRTIRVALDGSGDFSSLQEAVDSAQKGDTVWIKAGTYAQDLTIHSKEKVTIVGENVDKVILVGQGQMVGVLHVGKWPYGATDIEISGLTINEHGGHALGIFNGQRITLRQLHVNGMVFGQQVQDVRIEDCVIGGSETTGVHFSDSHALLVGNVIHGNDYGVNVTGKSSVRLERNVIIKNVFEAVLINDHVQAVLRSNTLAKNGTGVAFVGLSSGEASGNVLSLNKVGFLIAPSSRTALSYNALSNQEADYMKGGSPPVRAPELRPESDIAGDPGFLDVEHDDFRLAPDTPLLNRGMFRYLGALPPATIPAGTAR